MFRMVRFSGGSQKRLFLKRSDSQAQVSGVDILGCYLGISTQAVRWEGLQDYRVSWEDDQIIAWRHGLPPPPNAEVEGSLATIRQITESGRRIARLRGVRRPASEYTRYEFEVAYPANSVAGEEIYVVDLDVYREFDDVDDFVIFDDDAVLRYRYTFDGRLLAYDLSDDPTDVAAYGALRDRLYSAAVPLASFVL
jgi:hypothetical protein